MTPLFYNTHVNLDFVAMRDGRRHLNAVADSAFECRFTITNPRAAERQNSPRKLEVSMYIRHEPDFRR